MISLLKISDREGHLYEQGELMFSSGSGVTLYRRMDEKPGVLVKLPPDNGARELNVRRMSAEKQPEKEKLPYLLWPREPLYENGGSFYGYLAEMPESGGGLRPLTERCEKARRSDPEEKKNSVRTAFGLAKLFRAVRDMGGRFAMRGITPGSFCTDSDGNVFFTDIVSAMSRTRDGNRGVYTAPELLMGTEAPEDSEDSDAFILALILFRVLTGYFPFDPGQAPEQADPERILDLMCDGRSVFSEEGDEAAEEAVRAADCYSRNISSLFRRAFDYCGRPDYRDGRPSAEEWMEGLSEWLIENC